jgi:hypothetical protein
MLPPRPNQRPPGRGIATPPRPVRNSPPPKREPAAPAADEHEFQPNPDFTDRAEMDAWLAQNVPGATVVEVWEVRKLACRVRAKFPRGVLVTVEKKGKKR